MHRKLSAFPLCCVGNHYTLYFLSVFSVILSTYVVIFWFVSGSVVALLSSWAIPPARCMAMLLYSGQCPADGIQLCCDRQTLSFSFTVYCVLRLLLLLLTYSIRGDLNLHPYSGAWVYGRQYILCTPLFLTKSWCVAVNQTGLL